MALKQENPWLSGGTPDDAAIAACDSEQVRDEVADLLTESLIGEGMDEDAAWNLARASVKKMSALDVHDLREELA